jgi:cardiolipin synthase
MSKIGMAWRRLRAQAKRGLRRILGQRDSAARIARGVAAGFFATAFPIPGLQIPLSLFFAWIARGNKAVALLPQFLSNAVTMLPQAFLQFKVGAWLWPGEAARSEEAVKALRLVVADWNWAAPGQSWGELCSAVGSLGMGVLGPLVLGILITGFGAAVASYPPTVITVWTWRAWQRSRRLRKGLPPSPVVPLVIPPGPSLPLVRKDLLMRYAGYPARFQRASAAKLLVDGREAYPEMLAAIDSAKVSVDLETYIFRADRVGARFQEALRQAARRGVNVRLLYDYVGSLGLPDRFVRDLTDAGVNVAVYNPLILTRPMWAVNRRDHRKILVVDRQVMFIGGLNIADDYAAVEDGGGGWRDTQIRLDGPEVAEAGERLFALGWRWAIAYPETVTRVARLKARARKRLGKLVTIREAWRRTPGALGAALTADDVAVQVIGNGVFRHRWRIRRAYLRAIRRARRYILIENAYFIPDRAVRRGLARAVSRGVAVAVVVARRSDVTLAAHASRSLYSELLSHGVRIFEWPHGMMHAKTAVVDDAWAIVGSYNFDHRSFLHQLEAVALVADPGVAARLRDQTLADVGQCHEVTLQEHESRSWGEMLLESGAFSLRYWL